MSEAKHTPGPWKVVRGHQGVFIGIADANGVGVTDARFGLWGDGEELNANARLIAAAPVLLERLEKMQRFLIGERDAFYDSCANLQTGEVDDPDDKAELDSMDADIDANAAVIRAAKGQS